MCFSNQNVFETYFGIFVKMEPAAGLHFRNHKGGPGKKNRDVPNKWWSSRSQVSQREPYRAQSPAWRTNEASDPSVPSPKDKQTHKKPAHMSGKTKNILPEGPLEAAKWVFTWTQEDEASDRQELLLFPAPEVLEKVRVALPLVSGPTSGRRTENLSSGRVRGEAGGGGRSRLRTAWPTQGGTPPKRLTSVFRLGGNNNIRKTQNDHLH